MSRFSTWASLNFNLLCQLSGESSVLPSIWWFWRGRWLGLKLPCHPPQSFNVTLFEFQIQLSFHFDFALHPPIPFTTELLVFLQWKQSSTFRVLCLQHDWAIQRRNPRQHHAFELRPAAHPATFWLEQERRGGLWRFKRADDGAISVSLATKNTKNKSNQQLCHLRTWLWTTTDHSICQSLPPPMPSKRVTAHWLWKFAWRWMTLNAAESSTQKYIERGGGDVCGGIRSLRYSGRRLVTFTLNPSTLKPIGREFTINTASTVLSTACMEAKVGVVVSLAYSLRLRQLRGWLHVRVVESTWTVWIILRYLQSVSRSLWQSVGGWRDVGRTRWGEQNLLDWERNWICALQKSFGPAFGGMHGMADRLFGDGTQLKDTEPVLQDLPLTLEELYNGAVKVIKISKKVSLYSVAQAIPVDCITTSSAYAQIWLHSTRRYQTWMEGRDENRVSRWGRRRGEPTAT